MTRRVTIADVAREAGVSMMTVSRVINNKGEVSTSTREAVRAAIERLGYRPSSIARGLATRRTATIGLVVPDVANPFFADVAGGVEQVASGEGYNVFLCNTGEDPEREAAVLRLLEEKRVDGVVVCSSRLDDCALQAALDRHPAAVLVNRHLPGDEAAIASVRIDDRAGGRLATQHLLQSGHRAVGFLAGPPASRSSRLRGEGYRAALAAAGVGAEPEWTVPCAANVEGGFQATRTVLSRYPEVTALFCYNDLVAVGALQACAALGRSVPGDVAIAGFDDIPLAELVTPPLTTCRVPRVELGVRAVRLLLDQIAAPGGPAVDVVLQPELVVRASAPAMKVKARA